jgi:hypothetical protein
MDGSNPIEGENIFRFKFDLVRARLLGERSLGDLWQEANALYYLGWELHDYVLKFC